MKSACLCYTVAVHGLSTISCLHATTSDMFPAQAVASVVGLGGMAGAIGGMLIAKLVAHILQFTDSYIIPFAIAGLAYLAALAIIHALAPRLDPVNVD